MKLSSSGQRLRPWNTFTILSAEFSTWLRLTPERIYMTPLSAANNQVRVSIGLITGAELTIGPKPAAAPSRPLPPVQIYSTFDRNFHIRLVADVFYADLVTALTPVLVDKTFGDDRKITVKGFSVRGEDDRLAVVLATSGDFDGELTVFAKPVYHPENNSLTFENVDFDTRNTGWLIGQEAGCSAVRLKHHQGKLTPRVEQLNGPPAYAPVVRAAADHVS